MVQKVYIEVNAVFRADGTVRPVSFVWTDGVTYTVDRVRYAVRAAATNAGGCGIRYTVSVCGRDSFIFRDGDRWFVEARC